MTSKIIRIYLILCTHLPQFKKTTRKWMYEVMARFIRQESWTYMNYGYSHINGHEVLPDLEADDEINRLSFQLYHHLANEIDMKDKVVLEVGSGRGGGATMLKKYHKPERLVGLDYSRNAIRFCNKRYKSEGLSFVNGDAENLPFENAAFDAVINVESSHCYSSMDKFLHQVKKVLKPGGHFLYTDFRDASEIEELEMIIAKSGLLVIKKTDITQNVLLALDKDHDRRIQEISENVPAFFKGQFMEFAGVKNSVIYNEFNDRKSVYFSYVMMKTFN